MHSSVNEMSSYVEINKKTAQKAAKKYVITTLNIFY